MGIQDITLLDHSSAMVSRQIWLLFQKSYKVEADILWLETFPPLQRSEQDIQVSSSRFYGIFESIELVAALEVKESREAIDFDSLVVHPQHFRQGFATRLIGFVLEIYKGSSFRVKTAKKNLPGLALYRKFGFNVVREINEAAGIEVLELER